MDYDEEPKGGEAIIEYAETLLKGLSSECPFFLLQLKEDPGGAPSAKFQEAAFKRTCGAIINKRYKLTKLLGAGSFGQGWKAQDLASGKDVFLKTFKFGSFRGAKPQRLVKPIKKVIKELTNARNGLKTGIFRHVNVVDYFDAQYYGTCVLKDGTNPSVQFPFLVTEFVDGPQLQDYCSDYFTALWYRKMYPSKVWPHNSTHEPSKPKFLDDPKNIRFLFMQLMRGVAYLHAQKVYVWDIKADNLMVTRRDKTLKIMDFGMGKITEGRKQTKKGAVQISLTYQNLPGHTAPELNPAGLGGIHRTDWKIPGPVDIYLAGQMLLGMTCLKEHMDYMIKHEKWDLPAFNVSSYSAENIKCFDDMFKISPNMQKRFVASSEYPDGPHLYDLLKRMLDSDPTKRPTAEEVLKHPWCAGGKDLEAPQIPTASSPSKVTDACEFGASDSTQALGGLSSAMSVDGEEAGGPAGVNATSASGGCM